VETIQELITSGGWLALLGALLGGMLTALNPCVLIMIPLIMGFIGGVKDGVSTKRALGYSLLLVLGFAVQLALLFTVMASLAPHLRGAWMGYVVAALCILVGAHFLELYQVPLLISQEKLPRVTGALGALVFGFLFGVISLPCTGPALSLILAIVPERGAPFGGALLLLYGIGHCALILVVGTSTGAARHLIESKLTERASRLVKKTAGAFLIGVGLYLIAFA